MMSSVLYLQSGTIAAVVEVLVLLALTALVFGIASGLGFLVSRRVVAGRTKELDRELELDRVADEYIKKLMSAADRAEEGYDDNWD